MLSNCYLHSCRTNAKEPSQDKAMEDKPIKLINPFIVPEQELAATIAMWDKARGFLETQPGYISTELHQSLSPGAQYRLVNVAVWKDAASFQAAMTKMREKVDLPRIEGVLPHPELYQVIRQ